MEPSAALGAFTLYAALNTLILIWLAFNVGQKRTALKISIGDGNQPTLIRAMRGQANFVETVPLALLLLLATTLQGAPALVIHIFGLALTLGRVFHALHFTADDAPGWQRGAGAGLTVLVLGVLALGLIGHALYALVAA
ncbi:MAG: MAPEG family protein [Pseudomonadota bacterium]